MRQITSVGQREAAAWTKAGLLWQDVLLCCGVLYSSHTRMCSKGVQGCESAVQVGVQGVVRGL